MASVKVKTPKAKLHWRGEDGIKGSIEISERLFIGRMCAGVPATKCLLVDGADVSRDHAILTCIDNRLTIRDTSRNGTRLNGSRLTPGVDYTLHDADIISIGRHYFVVEMNEDDVECKQKKDFSETMTIALDEYLTHLVADVRGFTALTQSSLSSDMLSFMCEIFDRLSSVVFKYQGTVKDYAGDCIFAYWEHGPHESAEKALLACRAAMEQQAVLLEDFGEANGIKSEHVPALGWGISTGRVTLSNYGQRNENIAIVGDATNLAFRLSDIAGKSVASTVVMCEKTARLVRDSMQIVSLGECEIKGRIDKENIYGLAEFPE